MHPSCHRHTALSKQFPALCLSMVEHISTMDRASGSHTLREKIIQAVSTPTAEAC